MTELDVLDRNIKALKELLRAAWRDLAFAELTSYERREMRNQMNRAAADLRFYLQAFETEADRLRKLSAEMDLKRSSRAVQFRILAQSNMA
jgi:hypothetical protein